MLRKRKTQLVVLSALLVAVIVAGVWFLSGGPQNGESGMPEDVPDPETNGAGAVEMAEFFDLSDLKPMQFSVEKKEEDVAAPPNGMINYATILSYEGQFCQLTYQSGETVGDFSVDVVSMPDGETLHSFPREDFPASYDFQDSYGQVELGDNFMALTLDENGGLWAFYLFWGEGDFKALIAPCKPDATEGDIVALGVVSDQWYWPTKFLVGDGRAFLSSYGRQLAIVDLSDGSYFNPSEGELVFDFCLDEDGDLYYVWGNPSHYVNKYSLKEGKTVWTKDFSFYLDSRKISYTSPGGLFVSGGNDLSDTGGIYWIDPKTGDISRPESYHELINFGLDLDVSEDFRSFDFVVDGQYRIYASYYDFDWSSEEAFLSVRYTYLLEPEIRDISPNDIVTLTITSPYKVESVANAIHNYQRHHPEIEVVWDTQYISREELQKNFLEYKDQIALRTMTGEVGDLQMILGSGLGQDVITDTDAFVDLSGYLENCPFRDELGWNMIETLRGEDGAIRAVPLAAYPSGYIWDMSLLEELGSPVDPDTATWSELLDLALQWQEEGANLSLIAAVPGEDAYWQNLEDNLLYSMLLANLYSAEQADGTVQLDQPYLRDLLTKWARLHGSTQLVRRDGTSEKTLLSYISNYGSTVYDLVESETPEKHVYMAALPKGDLNKKQQGRAVCWCIPASSENREAAWELLQYLISADGLPGHEYSADMIVNEHRRARKTV